MLRFSILSVIALGCGSTVTEAPVTTDSGAPDTSAIDTGSPPIDTGDVPRPDTGPLPGSGARPPARPTVMVAGGSTKWFALKQLQLGISRKTDGAADANAWKGFGYDLDARTTTRDDSKTSLNTCRRLAGSPTSVLADGDLGRDNNFGQHFMSVIKSLKADAEDAVNGLIRGGQTTLLIRLDNVGPTDNASVPGALYLAANLGSAPKFDGTDKWPLDPSSVDAMLVAKTQFPKGYMAGGVWVSGEIGTTSAAIPVPAVGTLAMESVVISFNVTTGGDGVIAGGSQTNKFIDAITPMAKAFGICPGNATYEQVVSTASQSADLVSGAPAMQDTSRECNALSIGLGFVAAPAAASTATGTPTPFPSGC